MKQWPIDRVHTSRGDFALRRRQGDGRPLVLIHGWPESSATWTPLLAHLPAELDVIAPDLRGLGDSPRTAERDAYGKQALAQDVLAVVQALGIDHFALVGHDWGGIVAQETALAEPMRVTHLGVSNIAVINNLDVNRRIAGKPNRYVWYQHFLNTGLPEALIPGRERAFLETFLRMSGDLPFPEAQVQEYVRCYAIPGTPTTAANLYRSYRSDIRRWASLAGRRFDMPAAYIYGEHDVVITPDYLDGLEACFRDIRITRLDAGHFVQEEQPAAFADAVVQLLQR